MNDPLESTESDQPLHDQSLGDQSLLEGLPTSLEQQLRALRPRAPQLQMDLIDPEFYAGLVATSRTSGGHCSANGLDLSTDDHGSGGIVVVGGES